MNYGFISEDFGGIDEGHKALYLWDHGRAAPSNFISPGRESTYSFKYKPIPQGERVTIFIGLEEEDGGSRIMSYNNSEAFFGKGSGIKAPYVYVYTTAKPDDIEDNSEYGLKVFDSNGAEVYHSKYKTLQPVSTTLVPMGGKFGGIDPVLISGVPSNRKLAYIIPAVYGFIIGRGNNQPGDYLDVGARYCRRVGNDIRGEILHVQRISVGQDNPSLILNIFQSYYGRADIPEDFSNTLLTLVDVTDIQRK